MNYLYDFRISYKKINLLKIFLLLNLNAALSYFTSSHPKQFLLNTPNHQSTTNDKKSAIYFRLTLPLEVIK